ncbi:MAG: hypothetical protein NTV25_04685 [Methanothrix sp.]|jgi:hypothetical protein|nr:hypothetical protein [Methanothrix sp.]
MRKNVDNSLYRALKLYGEGRLSFGQAERDIVEEKIMVKTAKP